jgi:arylsulfatase A-like enzyme
MTHTISRRRFLSDAATGVAAASTIAPLAAAGLSSLEVPRQRPNVLFLMTDEQTFQSLSMNGCPYIDTPNMDRIGLEGVSFNNATCVTPYCSPSRASFLTGQYPHRHDILKNVSPSRQSVQAPLLQDAFPNTESLLLDAGYATAHRGKWHLGDKGEFDCYESFGYASRASRGYTEYLNEVLPQQQFADHPSPGKYQNRPVKMLPRVEQGFHEFHADPNNRLAYISIIGRSLIPPEHLPETLITDQVIEKIEANKDGPFMITASWSPPHDLWVIPEPYYSMIDRNAIEIPGSFDMPEWDQNGPSKRLGNVMGREGIREYMGIYYGMVKYIDDQVGRILQYLEKLEILDDTLIVFTTDHGDMVGAHGCIGKSITSIYDDLLKIPLMIRYPQAIDAGTTVEQPVSQIDVMPTLLDYVGLPIPKGIHGESTRPLIEGRNVAWRDHAFCQRADASRMIRTADYKYTLRTNNGTSTLYNLKNDPLENDDLATDPARQSILREMHERLINIMRTDGDQLFEKFT